MTLALHTPSGITGDALMAVTGVESILAQKPKRITARDKELAEMLPRDIRRACRRFLEDEAGLPRKIPSRRAFDYADALDKITAVLSSNDNGDPTVQQQHVEAIMHAFRGQDNELAMQYANVAKRLLLYLQKILPIRTETTMVKSINIDPSDGEIAEFRRAWDIAEDPMIVLRDMDMGILVPDQVTHLAALYPDGYELMKNSMRTEIGNALARKKSWKPSFRRDNLMQTFFQTTLTPQDFAADLQGNFELAKANKPSPGPAPAAPSKSSTQIAANTQTKASQIADGSAAG